MDDTDRDASDGTKRQRIPGISGNYQKEEAKKDSFLEASRVQENEVCQFLLFPHLFAMK